MTRAFTSMAVAFGAAVTCTFCVEKTHVEIDVPVVRCSNEPPLAISVSRATFVDDPGQTWSMALQEELPLTPEGVIVAVTPGRWILNVSTRRDCGDEVLAEQEVAFKPGGANVWTLRSFYLDGDQKPDLVLSYHASGPHSDDVIGFIVALSLDGSLQRWDYEEGSMLHKLATCWWTGPDGKTVLVGVSGNAPATTFEFGDGRTKRVRLPQEVVVSAPSSEEAWAKLGMRPLELPPFWDGTNTCRHQGQWVLVEELAWPGKTPQIAIHGIKLDTFQPTEPRK